jgi:hypothetical protein
VGSDDYRLRQHHASTLSRSPSTAHQFKSLGAAGWGYARRDDYSNYLYFFTIFNTAMPADEV